jgi:hypothetical protein
MSRSSGAAQYWFWYVLEPKALEFHFTAAQKFIDLSGFASRENFKPIAVEAQTTGRASLRFGPGIDWAPSRQTHFTLPRDGNPQGIGGMSAFLQGKSNNHEMFPFAEFAVDYSSAGTFAVHVDRITASGAQLELSVDGEPATSLALGQSSPAPVGRAQGNNGSRIDATLAIPVPPGNHIIRMENTGLDWLHIREFTLAPYAPALAVLAKGNADSAVLWIYRRDQLDPAPITGIVSVPGLAEGSYRVAWWDTYKGEVVKEESGVVKNAQPLRLTTPLIERDLAAFIDRAAAATIAR